jgi:large subunit ribosomal protein L10
VSLNRQEKAVVIEEVSAEVAKAQSIVMAEYRGLDVASVTVLRKTARESGVYLRVLKNTLVRRALTGTSFEGISYQLTGPLIYAISTDPVSAAKVLAAFAKTNEALAIRGGALPNNVLSLDGVKALATMPSRDELLAKLLGTMQAPITQFVRTLNEIPTGFVRGLAAVRDQKQAA